MDELNAPARERRCPQCGGPLDVRTPHVVIDGSAVRAYCSAECVTRSTAPIPLVPLEEGEAHATLNPWLRRLVRVGVGLPFLAFTSFGPAPVETPRAAAPQPVLAMPPAPIPEEPRFGPAWPPSDKDWEAEIASDAWIHPLDGPKRRMPISDSRVFGAERPGERPGECNNGHCGVDLSGPWGEPVHAAHDGVVDRVQRGANEEHGGMYVRLAHRNGTIFSQYFHLAAIPRRLEVGSRVRVGEVIGLLGDTGVKHSAPHLHFTISVKPSEDVTERYIDPEPLIALWPLRIPVDETVGMLTAQAAPGVPHGAAPRHKKRHTIAAAPQPAEAATE
jgi:murein DD-endopeptidase MepM/ murein hydrolase activator NlpD